MDLCDIISTVRRLHGSVLLFKLHMLLYTSKMCEMGEGQLTHKFKLIGPSKDMISLGKDMMT